MEKSKKDALIKRAAAAAVMAPATLAVIYIGIPCFNLFVMFLGCLLAWEWAEMAAPAGKKSLYVSIYAFSVSAAVWTMHIIVIPLALVLATAVAAYKSRGEKRRGLLVLGVPYITLGLGCLVWLYLLTGMAGMFWYFLLIWCVDVGGYAFGTTIKGPKLAPKISPNKTWAGLIGGMLLATAFSAVYGHYALLPYWGKAFTIAAPFLAVIAQIGDLIESHIKRSLGLKDSSNLIPGHGGIFDRIDGLIFAAPFALLLTIVVFHIQ